MEQDLDFKIKAEIKIASTNRKGEKVIARNKGLFVNANPKPARIHCTVRVLCTIRYRYPHNHISKKSNGTSSYYGATVLLY